MNFFRDIIHAKTYEPVKRNKDGWRYHSHRFPIKNGISWREVMLREMNRPNPLFKILRIKENA